MSPMPPRPVHLVDTTMFWSPTGGGVRRYLEAKCRWLEGWPAWKHTIATPVADAPGIVELPSLPLPGSGGYRLPVSRRDLSRRLQALRPDLIEAGDPYRLAWASLDAARRLGVPAVAFCHSNIERLACRLAGPRLGPAAGRAARRYARHLYRNFDLVLAPSEAMRQHVLDWGVPNAACQPLGVDTHVFNPARRNAQWREQLGLPPQVRLLVYAGRWAPEKNLDALAAAVQRLGEPYVLLLLGAGPSRPSGDRVAVGPHISHPAQLAAMLASADAFVHAGDQETFGLSVLEAMACGTPVVARAAEGLAELVDDEVGAAVPSGRPEDFAQAINSLFTRDREALSQAARQRAMAHDWNCVLPSLLVHYQRLLQQTAATGSRPNPLQPQLMRLP